MGGIRSYNSFDRMDLSPHGSIRSRKTSNGMDAPRTNHSGRSRGYQQQKQRIRNHHSLSPRKGRRPLERPLGISDSYSTRSYSTRSYSPHSVPTRSISISLPPRRDRKRRLSHRIDDTGSIYGRDQQRRGRPDLYSARSVDGRDQQRRGRSVPGSVNRRDQLRRGRSAPGRPKGGNSFRIGPMGSVNRRDQLRRGRSAPGRPKGGNSFRIDHTVKVNGKDQRRRGKTRTNSSDETVGTTRTSDQTVASNYPIEVVKPNENKFIRALRKIRILAPHPNEDPIDKKIRVFQWIALTMDMASAIFGLATFGRSTTQCCGRSILSNYGRWINWDIAIVVLACLYPLLILIEVIPVMVYALPCNLLNPLIGVLIGFSVFLTDGLSESMIMWVLETISAGCSIAECTLHKKKFRMVETRRKRLAKQARKVERRNDRPSLDCESTIFTDGSNRMLNLNNDIESQRFNIKKQKSTMKLERTDNDPFKVVREHRTIVKEQKKAEFNLYRFYILVGINISVTCLTFLLIFMTWKNGGICVVDYKLGNIFKNNQVDKCNRCWPDDFASGPCEVCEDAGSEYQSQCYFPFRWDA